jgi:hypothetical protein
MPGPIYYTVAQAARRLAMLEAEALRLIASSGIRPCEAGRRLLFPAAEIDALAEQQRQKAEEKRRERESSRSGRVVVIPPPAVSRRPRTATSLTDEEGSDSGLFDKVNAAGEGAAARKPAKPVAHSPLDESEGSTSGLFDQVDRAGR